MDHNQPKTTYINTRANQAHIDAEAIAYKLGHGEFTDWETRVEKSKSRKYQEARCTRCGAFLFLKGGVLTGSATTATCNQMFTIKDQIASSGVINIELRDVSASPRSMTND